MPTGQAAASVPLARHGVRIALLAPLALVLLLVVIVGGLVSSPSRTAAAAPPPAAIADIPADYLALYEQAATRFGIDWSVLAAIGKIECDHGRSQGPGCSPPGTVNAKGATG